MMSIESFGLVLMLLSITACAPVVYDGAYYGHSSPSGHVSVSSTYRHTSYSRPAYQSIHPIKVTLYADNSYLGVYFRPINIVIADGDYVEIPVKNRRGRHSKIFAHYHQQDLHFDSSRNCQRIHGSTGFKADKRWDKGHKYTHINAGKDYDLSGLQMHVRNIPASKRQPIMTTPKKVANNRAAVTKTHTKQTVKHKQVRQTDHRNVARKQRQSSYNGQAKTQNKSNVVKGSNGYKASQPDVRSIRGSEQKSKKPAVRPHIVQKIVKDNKSLRVSGRTVNAKVTKPDDVRKGKESQKVERAGKNKKPGRVAAEGRQNTHRSQRQHDEKRVASKNAQDDETAKGNHVRVVGNEKSKGKGNHYGVK